MELGLKNKVAFVAASSHGLGKAVAIQLALEGARVIINGRNGDALNKAKQEIEVHANGEVLSVVGDLSVAKDRDQVIKTALDTYNRIDVLVTNSGGPPP